jgi:hypothetical protein
MASSTPRKPIANAQAGGVTAEPPIFGPLDPGTPALDQMGIAVEEIGHILVGQL